MSYHVRVVHGQEHFDVEGFRHQVERFWQQAVDSPKIQGALEKSDTQPLYLAGPAGEPAIVVNPRSQGFIGVEAIVISVVGGVLTTYTVRALDYMWQTHVWPSLKARYGDQISCTDSALNKSDEGEA
jgi:hypothetical protein